MASKLKFPYAGHHEPTSRRVRVYFGPHFELVADTTSAHFVWEHAYFPQYYIPSQDVKLSLNSTSEEAEISGIGKVQKLKLSVDGKETDAVQKVLEGELKDFIRFNFNDMDAWFEEDTQIHCHPKDPYKRIDTLTSSRNITIKISGTEIANTGSSPIVTLHETGLPTRYYVPKTALKWNYVRPSDTKSICPYKGEANYYSVVFNGVEYKDVIWYYPYPIAESVMIRDLVCFYNEKVEVWIDGVKEEQPKSKFG